MGGVVFLTSSVFPLTLLVLWDFYTIVILCLQLHCIAFSFIQFSELIFVFLCFDNNYDVLNVYDSVVTAD